MNLHIYHPVKMLCLGMAFMLLQTAASAQNKQPQKQNANKNTQQNQEPEKDSLKIVPAATIAVLDGATGYIKSTTGKWLSSANRIPYDDNDYNNEYYEKFKIGTENFKQIRVMPLTINGKKLYAIIVQHTKGYYKNQEKEEDWRYFSAADYFVVDKKEFKKLLPDSFDFNKPYTASLFSHYTGTVPYTNVNQLGTRIAKDINTNIRTRHLYDTTVHAYFQMGLKPVKDKRGKHMRFHIGINYAKTGSKPTEADYSLFSTQYYELPFERFRQFAAALRK